MNFSPLYQAERVATAAHEGQKRWGGEPYIIHPRAVAEACPYVEQKIVAWLHDVVEDTSWTLEDLRIYNFTPKIIDAVDAMTQRVNESYANYILRVKENPIARVVKIKDITHNLTDIKPGKNRDKYEVARMFLLWEDLKNFWK